MYQYRWMEGSENEPDLADTDTTNQSSDEA